MNNSRLATVLVLGLALGAISASAESLMKADAEVEKPCIEPALAEQLESQLMPLLMQTDTLLRALIEDKETATAPATMYFLGRNLTLLERSRYVEYAPDAFCPIQIERLDRDTQMVIKTYAALLNGGTEIGIAQITNKAAMDALPQLLAQAQTLEKTVKQVFTDSKR